jgi:nitroimidazol reductase NimA-like FMN-containing flavoprotein (pyridoxamine 5'-phosphate oxidase superfamily)
MEPSVQREPSTVAGPAAGRVLTELTREECLHRLAGASFGRVAVAGSGVAPVIRPVNYRFDERSQSVVFRTREGSKLAALLSSAQAAFEIDEIDSPPHPGWSVIVAGVTEQITDAGELKRLSTTGELPWTDGCAGQLIRIRARSVSGRSIGSDRA